MGVYLSMQIKESAHITPEDANRLWFEMYPSENSEASLLRNFDTDPQGPTVHFYTKGDLLEDARYYRDVDKRPDLGFEPGMTDQEAIKVFQEGFPGPGWSDIGGFTMKLSGEHYCTHKMERVRKFIQKYKESLVVHGYKDLLRYIKYDSENISFLSSCYCEHCLLKARRHGIFLPVKTGMIDTTGKNIQSLYDALFENERCLECS